jgi:hypothetical protein
MTTNPGLGESRASHAKGTSALAITLTLTVALAGLGHSALDPHTLSIEGVIQWLQSNPPWVEALAIIRAGALAIGIYCSASIALLLMASRCQNLALAHVSSALVNRRLRSVLESALGLTLTVGLTLGPAVGAHATSAGPGQATIVTITTIATDSLAPTHDAPPTMPGTLLVRLPTAELTTPTAEQPSGDTIHVVHPGEHLWGLAQAVVALHGTTDPTDAQITPYWRQVIRANPQLIDPDVIRPGDQIRLPPFGSTPSQEPASDPVSDTTARITRIGR